MACLVIRHRQCGYDPLGGPLAVDRRSHQRVLQDVPMRAKGDGSLSIALFIRLQPIMSFNWPGVAQHRPFILTIECTGELY